MPDLFPTNRNLFIKKYERDKLVALSQIQSREIRIMELEEEIQRCRMDIEAQNKLILQLDHTCLNNVFPFTEINPSSENIARWLYDSLKKRLQSYHVDVSAVTVWESDTASATYYEE